MLYLNIFVYMIFSPCVLWLLVKSVKEIILILLLLTFWFSSIKVEIISSS